MRFCTIALILALLVVALAACGGDAPPPAGDDLAPTSTAEVVGGSATTLDESYEGALPVSSQLALGTLNLEGTANAVTAEQAKSLLPLWQVLQAGTLQSDAETGAVLKQIEGTMDDGQLAAIAAMELTFEDIGPLFRERGLGAGLSPEAMATRQAGGGGAGLGQGQFGNLTPEELADMRATRQAGGEGGFGQGGFRDLSEEEREAMRATAEASGVDFGGLRGGAPRGQISLIAELVVELLAERAAE